MKVKTTFEMHLDVKAVFRDGVLKLQVSARAPYGTREAGITLDDFPKEVTEQFETLFSNLIESVKDDMVLKAQAAQAQALTVASRMGEI